MSDYTATDTQEVRFRFAEHGYVIDDPNYDEDRETERFNAWLAQIEREAAARALEDAASDWAADPDSWGDNEKDFRNELRDRAGQMRSAT